MTRQPPKRTDQMPTTRLARSALLGGLAAREGAQYVGTRAANVGRSPEGRRLALERRHLEAADQLLNVLGTMKGPAMKIGQLLSFVDLGLPADVQPYVQSRLASLCDAAPPIPFGRMQPVLVNELSRPLASVFSDLDETPVGIASIGQVYRGRLIDGRQVAVKVQFPRIAAAARADMKNLSFMLRRVAPLVPGIDMDSLGRELADRVSEELDYVREAESHRQMARSYDGHPFIHVPRVVEELSGPRLIVTEWVEGIGFDQLIERSQAERDHVGEIIMRFYMGSLFRLQKFSGDPHPGNLTAMPDGRLGFFDFGSFATMENAQVAVVRAVLTATAEGQPDAAWNALVGASFINRPEQADASSLADYLDRAVGHFLRDRVVEITPALASQAFTENIASSDYAGQLRGQSMPSEWALIGRTSMSTTALLGQLHARGNWNAILREWLLGSAPATELGVAEHRFFGPFASQA